MTRGLLHEETTETSGQHHIRDPVTSPLLHLNPTLKRTPKPRYEASAISFVLLFSTIIP
jgi:hypothetical protein